MADSPRFRPVAYVKQEELDSLAEYVNALSGRLAIFESALANVIEAVDVIIEAVESAEEATDDPTDYGLAPVADIEAIESTGTEGEETPEEEAARLIAEAEAANESV